MAEKASSQCCLHFVVWQKSEHSSCDSRAMVCPPAPPPSLPRCMNPRHALPLVTLGISIWRLEVGVRRPNQLTLPPVWYHSITVVFLGMWIPLVGLPVFRTSLGRLVWGRRCSAAANGGRKYKQLLSTNSTMESVWCEDCVNCKRWGQITKVRRGDVTARTKW